MAAFIPANPSRQPDRGDERLWAEGDWLTKHRLSCVHRGGVCHAPDPSGVTAVDIRVSPSALAVPNSGQPVSEDDPVIAGRCEFR